MVCNPSCNCCSYCWCNSWCWWKMDLPSVNSTTSSAGKMTYILLTPPHGAHPKGGIAFSQLGRVSCGRSEITNSQEPKDRLRLSHLHFDFFLSSCPARVRSGPVLSLSGNTQICSEEIFCVCKFLVSRE